MKRTLTSAALIIALLSVTLTPSCDKKDDPTGPAIFIGTALLLGLTVGGWFQHDRPETFPPLKYDVLRRGYGEGKFDASILSPSDRDWYRTEMMRDGDTITIWSESEIGVRAVLVDENGKYYPSDNYAPGSNFKIKAKAQDWTSYYLMVSGIQENAIGPYELHWEYGY